MNKLTNISFNGIDEQTDIDRLVEIQRKYPLAEFGVLLSENWYKNGSRYNNPENLYKLSGLGLNLSAHLCGTLAKSAIRNDFSTVINLCNGYFNIFQRTQINVAMYGKRNPKELVIDLPETIREAIIQQKSANDCGLFMSYYEANRDNLSDKFSILIDGSGGQGISGEINVLPIDAKIGYAGGINEENVIEKLDYLMRHTKNFWIDMESGVRTDDWLDLDKVEHICSMVYEYLDRNKDITEY